MTRLITLLLALTLASCDLASLDPYAALQQPARTATQTTPHPAMTAKQVDTDVHLPPSTSDTPVNCTVTAGSLHVRTGAGVAYHVIGYLYAGDIVTIQNQRGAWYDIGTGWINSHYCEE